MLLNPSLIYIFFFLLLAFGVFDILFMVNLRSLKIMELNSKIWVKPYLDKN